MKRTLLFIFIFAISIAQDITGKWTTSQKSEGIFSAIYELKQHSDGSITGVTYGNPDPQTEFRVTITGYYDKRSKTFYFKEDKFIVKRTAPGSNICRASYKLKFKKLPSGEQYLEGTHTDIDCGQGTGIVKLYRYVPPPPKPKPKPKPQPKPQPKPKPKPKPQPKPIIVKPQPKPQPQPKQEKNETEELKFNDFGFDCNNAETITVYFDKYSEKVPERFYSELNKIADFMIKCKKVELDLTGFAEKGPDKGFERRIARDRAVRVKQYLVHRGVEPYRIHIKKWYDYDEGDITENPRRVEMLMKPKNS